MPAFLASVMIGLQSGTRRVNPMGNSGPESDRKGVFLISGLAALGGGLCCLTPIILVRVGLASLSVAADLGNVLYGNYKWIFGMASLSFLSLALWFSFRRKRIRTLDQARR